MRRWIILFMLCALLLEACTGPTSSTTGINNQPVVPTSTPVAVVTPNAALRDFGTSAYSSAGAIENVAARQQFLAAYQEGKPGRWKNISYTTEGGPISYQLEYEGNGTELRFIYDTTQDKFGAQQITTYTCQQLIEDQTALRLVGCNGAEQEEFIIP